MPLEPTKLVNGRMWQPGLSGNPSGRPVGLSYSLLRGLSEGPCRSLVRTPHHFSPTNFRRKHVGTAISLKSANLRPPGQSGNPAGKPPGTRTAFSQGFIRDFALVWAEAGLEAVRKVEKKSPEAFVAIAARICPNDVRLTLDLAHQNDRVAPPCRDQTNKRTGLVRLPADPS
jgi:hypothetical protein